MIRILKWVAVVAAVPVGLALAAAAYVLIASQVLLERTHPVRPDAIRAGDDPAALALGRHLVAVTKCMDCHGQDFSGKLFDAPGSTLFAPNLTALESRLSDADFDRAIRQGLRPDGRTLLVMPSRYFSNLSDAEASAIIGYLRAFPPRGAVSPDRQIGFAVRAALALGQVRTEADALAAPTPGPIDLGPRFKQGRHLTSVICADCHNTDLSGEPKGSFLPTPDLTIAAAYERRDFHTLMRTGKAAGGREVGVMSQVARDNFSRFSDAEVDAIYDYLGARGRALSVAPAATGGR